MTKFTLGNGTAEPQGLLTGATTTVSTTTGAAFALADLPKLEEAVPNRFRPRSVIFGNHAQANRARQFAAPASESVWEPTAQNGYSLWGYPFYEVSAMATTITATSKMLVQFDPRMYVVIDRIGMDIELTTPLFGAGLRPTGSRGVYAFIRNGGELLDANAARVLQAA